MVDDDRSEQDEAEGAREALRDLEVDQDEADKVTGGIRRAGDPCDGGE